MLVPFSTTVEEFLPLLTINWFTAPVSVKKEPEKFRVLTRLNIYFLTYFLRLEVTTVSPDLNSRLTIPISFL